VTRQPAQRTRRGRSDTRPPPEERSERVRAKPQRRSWPEQPGHLSAKPATSACASASSSTTITAGSFSHRAILATGPTAGKGQVVLKTAPRTGLKQAARPPGSEVPERVETGIITRVTGPAQPSYRSRPASHGHQD